jgi:CBS-domain-containing membrane protein
MLVQEAMSAPPIRLAPDSSMLEAAQVLARSQASDVMVADEHGLLVGVLSEGDLIRAILPDIDEIHAAGGSVADASRAFMRKAGELARQAIAPHVITDPLTVSPEDHVALAAVIMIDRQIRRLPVVDQNRLLVGTVSRSDLCRAVLKAGQ